MSRSPRCTFIGATLAVGFVEVVDHRMWEVLPVAAIPLYFAYRIYCDYVGRLNDAHRQYRDPQFARLRHVGRGQQRPGDVVERYSRTDRRLYPRTSAGPFARRRHARPRQYRAAASDQRGVERSDSPNAIARQAAFGCGCADSAGQSPSGWRWRHAALAGHHRSDARRTRTQAKRRAVRACGGRCE